MTAMRVQNYAYGAIDRLMDSLYGALRNNEITEEDIRTGLKRYRDIDLFEEWTIWKEESE